MIQRDYKDKLFNLLAVIHRDGGHYTDEYGIEKSVIDAMQLSSERVHIIDALKNAEKWGWALNEATWIFKETYEEMIGKPMSNTFLICVKTICRKAIMKYIEVLK